MHIDKISTYSLCNSVLPKHILWSAVFRQGHFAFQPEEDHLVPLSLIFTRPSIPVMNPSKYSQETLDRIKANAEAAKRRLARLNAEYLARQKARKLRPASKTTSETFGEAVARIEQESQSAA